MHTKIPVFCLSLCVLSLLFGVSASASENEPIACHLYQDGDPPDKPVLTGSCDGTLVSAFFEGAERQQLYRQGVALGNGFARPITFSGNLNRDFLAATATATFAKAQTTGYLAYFACRYASDRWQCGCKNTDCLKPVWQLQGFRHAVPAVSPLPPQDALQDIRLPEGFAINVFADRIDNARSLALGQAGTVFVGSRAAGKVYALRDRNGDGVAEERYELANGLDEPNGIAFLENDLYIAEVSRVTRLKDIEARLDDPPELETILDGLPAQRSHGWRYLAAGPDGRLYIGLGAPCNVCRADDPRLATIARVLPDGSNFEVIARGIRNTVGFDWQPKTGELFFTDNGRDRMGDDIPPDELNHLRSPGLDFGFPACHGKRITDPEFGRGNDCRLFEPPLVELGPHVAALGMRFYRGTMFPPEYRGDILIAEHGSWNRSEKIGYRVTRVDLDAVNGPAYEPFAEGFLSGDEVRGRPVDVLEMIDGALLVSDDKKGAVYRISYSGI